MKILNLMPENLVNRFNKSGAQGILGSQSVIITVIYKHKNISPSFGIEYHSPFNISHGNQFRMIREMKVTLAVKRNNLGSRRNKTSSQLIIAYVWCSFENRVCDNISTNELYLRVVGIILYNFHKVLFFKIEFDLNF